MYKRPYIKKPYASIRTDSGNEFKGVFQKYLYDESILHTVPENLAVTNNLANVESLNRQLGRIFNGYMNKKEEETGKVYRRMDNILFHLFDNQLKCIFALLNILTILLLIIIQL